ncbi:MAG: HEPN domain-containing protein [Planctomycetia bacterium]|jgi:HEPN domain-containing protein
MRSPDLAADYVRRAKARLAAVDALFAAESWADVVRESQEVVELALKGLLRAVGIEPPRIHDVSDVLAAEKQRFPKGIQRELDTLAAGSRMLRRDRELAFYGAEDLTPSGFYTKEDAVSARDVARRTVATVLPHVPVGG